MHLAIRSFCKGNVTIRQIQRIRKHRGAGIQHGDVVGCRGDALVLLCHGRFVVERSRRDGNRGSQAVFGQVQHQLAHTAVFHCDGIVCRKGNHLRRVRGVQLLAILRDGHGNRADVGGNGRVIEPQGRLVQRFTKRNLHLVRNRHLLRPRMPLGIGHGQGLLACQRGVAHRYVNENAVIGGFGRYGRKLSLPDGDGIGFFAVFCNAAIVQGDACRDGGCARGDGTGHGHAVGVDSGIARDGNGTLTGERTCIFVTVANGHSVSCTALGVYNAARYPDFLNNP